MEHKTMYPGAKLIFKNKLQGFIPDMTLTALTLIPALLLGIELICLRQASGTESYLAAAGDGLRELAIHSGNFFQTHLINREQELIHLFLKDELHWLAWAER